LNGTPQPEHPVSAYTTCGDLSAWYWIVMM
jgi:hypothetical protein